MKKIAAFIKFIESLFGLSNILTGIQPQSITSFWAWRAKQASVTIAFHDMSGFSETIIAAITSFIDAHEHVAEIKVVNNTIVIIINV